jgi:hypothetical protein
LTTEADEEEGTAGLEAATAAIVAAGGVVEANDASVLLATTDGDDFAYDDDASLELES